MRKTFFFATCLVCCVCSSSVVAAYINDTNSASIVASEQVQSIEWECIGKIIVYVGGATYDKRTVSLYMKLTGEAMYKIKVNDSEYIVTRNPEYKPNSNSGKACFKYVAGKYYLNLGLE